MKKPNLQTVQTGQQKTASTEQPNKPTSESKKARKSEGEKVVKRSFSLLPDHNAYIEKIAIDEGRKRGRSMNASEALRLIIDKARGQK